MQTKRTLKVKYSFRIFSIFILSLWWLPQNTYAKTDTLRAKKTDSVILLKPEQIIRGETRGHLPVMKPQTPSSAVKQASLYKVGSTRSFSGLSSLPSLSVSQDHFSKSYQQRVKTPVSDTVRQLINKIIADNKAIKQARKYIKFLDGKSLINFPQSLVKNVGGRDYVLTFHGVKLRDKYAAIQVSMALPIPQTQSEPTGERTMYFWGEVRLSQDGGFKGGQIGLLTDFPVKLPFREALVTFRKSTLGGQQPDGTFVTFDCNGFKDLGVKGVLEFSRNFVVPELSPGVRDTISDQRVKGTFGAVVGGWHDILLEIDFPQRFQMAKLDRFSFQIKKAVLDMSDERNAVGQTFPNGYAENYLPGNNLALWRGVSIKEFSLFLPPEFNKSAKDSTKTTTPPPITPPSNSAVPKKGTASPGLSIVARNALIDQQGFTGEVEARNLIALGKGKMGKWPFSVAHFYIKMEATQLRAGTFSGRVRLPITKPKNSDQRRDTSTYLKYSVIINPDDGDYVARVQFTKKMNMNLWAAKMEVLPSSSLQIGVKNGAFLAKAVLNGKFTDIGGDKFSKTLQLKEIKFERLTIKTTPPYLSVGAMSFGGINQTQKLGGFTFTITKLGFVQGEAERVGSNGLQVGGQINFVEGKNSFGAEAYGTIYGRLEDTPLGVQVPKFEHVELSRAVIDIDMGAFWLVGSVRYYKADPIYGHGFRGKIFASFGKGKLGIEVKAKALFGNVDGFNYWYADALMSFEGGIPLVANGVKLRGFGGGAYYHMSRGLNPDFTNTLGQTPSGITYVPDKKTFLGIKASVLLTGPSASTYNGEAGFEIAFNRNGGIRKIGFDASLVIAAPGFKVNLGIMRKVTSQITKLEASALKMGNKASKGLLSKLAGKSKNGPKPDYRDAGNGAIKAVARIDFDVENSVLHANLTVDINVAGGVVKGGGEAVFHFAPDTWYVHIGTPERRMGVNIMNVIQTGAYFMVGDNIPEMPPPPENVIRILGLQGEYNKDRDDAAMLAGKGLAFGADFRMDTGNMNFLMFYARFAAGLGFDVMLKKYADGVRCKGRPGNVGINNWYAQGQVYAFFEGEIGIRVSLPFKKGNFPIIQGELAALMQAKLPNPAWIRGIVGGQFSILGGLVKGKCRFEVEIGQRCELVGGSALSGIEIISDVSPAEGAPEVGVFTSPQATFNLAVNQNFRLKDVDDLMKTFRVKLDHFTVQELTSGRSIAGKLEWNEDHTVLALLPEEILPSEKVIKMSVQVSFEEYKGGRWVRVNGVVEKRAFEFKTGKAPDHIVRQNIAYSYPIIQQLNYYPKETNQGYIQLKQGRPDLFLSPEILKDFSQKVRFTIVGSEGTSFAEAAVSYDRDKRQVFFDLPQNLKLGNVYHWQIINTPKAAASRVDENVTNVTRTTSSNTEVSVTTKKLNGTRTVLKEKKVFDAVIRTSRYASMSAKFDAMRRTKGGSWPITAGVHYLVVSISGAELFDKFEIEGDGNQPALVEMEAALSDSWYRNKIYPLVYQGFQANGLQLSRDPNPLGIPPAKAIYIHQQVSNNILSSETLQPQSRASRSGLIVYDLPFVMKKDYMDLGTKAAARLGWGTANSQWMQNIANQPFPSISIGQDYEVIFRYKLPGSGKVTFERRFTINNPK